MTEDVHVGCERTKVYLVHSRHSLVQQQNDLTLRAVSNYIWLHTVQTEGFQNLSLVLVLQS